MVQQVALGLLQRQHRLRRLTIPHPERYLYTALTRYVTGMRRRPIMESEEVLAGVEVLPTLLMLDEHGIQRALGKLPPYIAYLIQLVYFEQVSIKDAVKRTNRAFHKRITLARARYWLRFRGTVGATLRKALHEYEEQTG